MLCVRRVAEELCRLFNEDKTVDMTPILRRSKEAARSAEQIFPYKCSTLT